MATFDLANRTVLLTGGSSGVGAALLERLSRRGCRVIVWSRRPPDLFLAGITHQAVDLADADALDDALDRLVADHPDLSLVVNNSGVGEPGLLLTTDHEDLDEAAHLQIAVNLAAPITIANRLFAQIAKRPSAMIVNNTSGLAVAPTANNPIYCATKAALRSFTQSMRYQAERDAPHVRVVEILLPVVETPMTTHYKMPKLSVEKAADRIVAGLEKGEAEIWVGQAAALRAINSVAPALGRWIVRRAAK